MPHKHLALLLTGGAFVALLMGQPPTPPPFALTIMHTNDTHANHEPHFSGDGGDSRLATVIKQIRREVKHSLLLDAGDRFTGTLFQRQWKGQDNVRIMNALGYQAFTLGNHEFDYGNDVLADFVEKLDFAVLSANVTFPGREAERLRKLVKPFVVLQVGGQSIGIIGLTTHDTAVISKPGEGVHFDADYTKCAQTAIDELTQRSVNKILLLTHLGLSEDIQLAGQLRHVDAIIGGHSHTLLSRTYKEASVTYPVMAKDKDGQSVPIVQAGGGDCRFLGRLDLVFDAKGRVIKSGGDTILLSRYITPDPMTAALVKELAEPIAKLKTSPIKTRDGQIVTVPAVISTSDVRDEENPLGNLIADAMRAEARTQMALLQGGSIRTDLPSGPMTFGGLYTILPFENTLCRFRLKGTDVLAALEHGLSRYQQSGNGRFLQVSGLRYAFDPKKPIGQRLKWAEVLDNNGKGVRIDPRAEYSVATDSYLRSGGDDFTMIRDKALDAKDFIAAMHDVVVTFVSQRATVEPKRENRIVKE